MAGPVSSQYAALPFQATLGPSGGQLPSGVAAVRVEVNVAAFNAALERYLGVLGPNVVEAVSEVALELLGRIQVKTPVDTGRLRASFHAVLPGSFGRGLHRYKDLGGKSFEGSLGIEAKTMTATTGEVSAAVGTNVDYAIFIEAGHSRQAPNGMVAVSVAEMTGALDQKVEEALRNAGLTP